MPKESNHATPPEGKPEHWFIVPENMHATVASAYLYGGLRRTSN
jgi:hypothetical protein